MSAGPGSPAVDAQPAAAARGGIVSRMIGSIGGPGIAGNVPIVALGAILGLVAGYLLGSLDSGTYNATTVVNGNVVGTSSPPELTSSDIIGTYTATELLYFGHLSKQMQTAIETETGEATATAPVAVVEKGTALLDITASGRSAEQSVKASTIAAQLYINDWRTRTVASIKQQIAATEATIEELKGDVTGAAGLQSQLAAQYYDLQATQTAPRLVVPATAAAATYSNSGTIVALLGALLGTLGGLGVLLLCRRRRDPVSADE